MSVENPAPCGGRCCASAADPQAVLASGSQVRVVEAAWARTVHSRRLVQAASDETRFQRDDVLLVRTDRGDVFARALADSARRSLPPEACARVVRRLAAAEADALLSRDESRVAEARRVFIDLARRHRLDMHLSDVEVTHGDARVVFFFTSPGRVDFRALVRELAGALRSRIELRQIGVRDEARCTGGLGPCGQPLCCATFLREFTAVTIRMAKVQGLVPNPQKVSGLCGRLMCCLAYEHPVYVEMMKSFPKVGSMVGTPKGEGKVRELQVLRNTVKVSLGPGVLEEFPLKDLQWKSAGAAHEPPGDEAEGAEGEEDLKGLED